MKFLSILFLALLVFNCSSDKNDDGPVGPVVPVEQDETDIPGGTNPDDLSKTHQLLMTGRWQLSPQDVIKVAQCRKKSFYEFTTNEEVIWQAFYYNLTSKECITNGETTSTYLLLNNDTELEITINSFPTIYTIVNITANELILDSDDLLGGPLTYIQ